MNVFMISCMIAINTKPLIKQEIRDLGKKVIHNARSIIAEIGALAEPTH